MLTLICVKCGTALPAFKTCMKCGTNPFPRDYDCNIALPFDPTNTRPEFREQNQKFAEVLSRSRKIKLWVDKDTARMYFTLCPYPVIAGTGEKGCEVGIPLHSYLTGCGVSPNLFNKVFPAGQFNFEQLAELLKKLIFSEVEFLGVGDMANWLAAQDNRLMSTIAGHTSNSVFDYDEVSNKHTSSKLRLAELLKKESRLKRALKRAMHEEGYLYPVVKPPSSWDFTEIRYWTERRIRLEGASVKVERNKYHLQRCIKQLRAVEACRWVVKSSWRTLENMASQIIEATPEPEAGCLWEHFDLQVKYVNNAWTGRIVEFLLGPKAALVLKSAEYTGNIARSDFHEKYVLCKQEDGSLKVFRTCWGNTDDDNPRAYLRRTLEFTIAR